MTTEQTFKVAGITVHGNVTKIRFTDNMIRRIKQFTKGGAQRVDFVELPSEMTKVQALQYLQTHDMFKSADDQAIIAEELAERMKTAKKPEVKVKVKHKINEAQPSLADIKERGQLSAVQIFNQVKDQIDQALI